MTRGRWGKPVGALLLAVLLAAIGYWGIYRPVQSSQAEQARIELSENLPAQLDALYQAVFEETKVQQAVAMAETMRTRGKALANEGNRTGALAAVTELTALRDRLRQEYTLRIVNRPGVDSGFWTIPDSNTAATNYYIVVEALDAAGAVLTLPVLNEENGESETVKQWAVRVPLAIYTAIAADKRDNGIIEDNEMGRKAAGFLDVEYTMPVAGGTITRW